MSGNVPPETVFYDGQCGLCHAAVRFVVHRDRRAAFQFAPLAGETFRRQVPQAARQSLPDTLVVRRAAGDLLIRSTALVHLLRRLGGVWGVVATLVGAVPRPLRDGAYDAVARARRRWFAPPASACPKIPSHLRNRFLP